MRNDDWESPMSIQELRKLRIQLGIAQKEVGEALHYTQTSISQKEIGKMPASLDFLQNYENFLTDVINDKINVPQSAHVGGRVGETCKIKNPVPREKAAALRATRKELNLKMCEVAPCFNISCSVLCRKEHGQIPISQEEYDRFMKYYKRIQEAEHGDRHSEAKEAEAGE